MINQERIDALRKLRDMHADQAERLKAEALAAGDYRDAMTFAQTANTHGLLALDCTLQILSEQTAHYLGELAGAADIYTARHS